MGVARPTRSDGSAVEGPGPAHEVVEDPALDSGRLVVLVAARGLGARRLREVDAGQLIERGVDVGAAVLLVVRTDEEDPRGSALEGHDDAVRGAQVLHVQSGERLVPAQPVGKGPAALVEQHRHEGVEALRRAPRSAAICRWAMGVAQTS